jgi:hypothetical protein
MTADMLWAVRRCPEPGRLSFSVARKQLTMCIKYRIFKGNSHDQPRRRRMGETASTSCS